MDYPSKVIFHNNEMVPPDKYLIMLAVLSQPLWCADYYIKRFCAFLASWTHHRLEEKTKFLRFWTIFF